MFPVHFISLPITRLNKQLNVFYPTFLILLSEEEDMSSDEHDIPPDFGLIAPLSLPPESKIPDPASGSSTAAEYDMYFRIVRDNPGLLNWSRTCLEIYRAQIEDLDKTSLSPEEKYRLLKGLTAVYGITLEKWVKIGEAIQQRG